MGGDITPLGSTPGVWPTMLQATKRGASSLPLFPLTNRPTRKYYLHSLPRAAFLLTPINPVKTTAASLFFLSLKLLYYSEKGRRLYF